MKKKAIVMERKGNRIILLAEDGSFIIQKASIPYPEIGDEVDIIVKKNRLPNISTAFIAVASVLLITFFLTNLIPEQNKVIPATGTVVRYVSIDINPSIELGVNMKNIVVSIEALNKDGTVIVKEIKNALDQPVDVLLERIVNEAVDKGYLAARKENNILIDVSSENPQDIEVLKTIELLSEKAAETLSKKNIKSSIGCVKTDLKLRESARERGMSAGKYALLKKAKEIDININEQDMKTLSIVKAIQNAGGDIEDIDKIISSITQEKKESPQKIQNNKNITIEKNSMLDKENQLMKNSKNVEINNEQKKNKDNTKTNSSPSKPEQTSQVKKNIKENSPNNKIETETNKEKKKKDKLEVKKHMKEKDNVKDKGKDNKDNKDKKNSKDNKDNKDKKINNSTLPGNDLVFCFIRKCKE
ncbi:MAG: anti-sigma factor domain-containing protein [Bacillota bacterium]